MLAFICLECLLSLASIMKVCLTMSYHVLPIGICRMPESNQPRHAWLESILEALLPRLTVQVLSGSR